MKDRKIHKPILILAIITVLVALFSSCDFEDVFTDLDDYFSDINSGTADGDKEYCTHNEITDTAKSPTCTEEGLTEGVHCSICNEVLKAQQIVSMLGHSYIDNVCERCGEIKPSVSVEGAYTRVDADGNINSDGDYILFGSYPQTEVKNNSLKETLNELAGYLPTTYDSYGWTSYGYYSGTGSVGSQNNEIDYMWYKDIEHGGEKYRGVYFVSYRPYFTDHICETSESYQDDNGFSIGAIYWFKYEPIKWRILKIDGNRALLLSEMIIDSQEYYDGYANGYSGNQVVYPNNYEYSNIRAWLNDDFYNTAFSKLQSWMIYLTEVDNSASNTSEFACNNTSDFVFLLSEKEASSSDFGFAAFSVYDEDRRKETTAYALSQGAYIKGANDNKGKWWLRTPAKDYSTSAGYVGDAGYIVVNGLGVGATDCGVCPALWINLSYEHVHEVVKDPGYEATCTEAGMSDGSYCAVCDEILSVKTVIPALGHDIVLYEEQPASCENDGYSAYEACVRHGCEYQSTRLIIYAFGHSWDTLPGVAPTCYSTGFGDGTYCTVCEAVGIPRPVLPEAHSAVTDYGFEPTCTSEGLTDGSHCELCGKIISERTVITALGHNTVYHEGMLATCQDEGYSAYETCTRCEYSTYKAINAIGHSIDLYGGKNATCEEVGYQAYEACTRTGCGYTTYEEIPALGHDIVYHIWQSATCEDDGWEAYETCKRSDCDYTTYEIISALGHSSLSYPEKAATCEDYGWGAYEVCTRLGCGYTTYQEIQALGHSIASYEAKAATCEDDGYEAYEVCKRDGCTYTTYESIAALGHVIVQHEGKDTDVCNIKGWKPYESCVRDGCGYTTYEAISINHKLNGAEMDNSFVYDLIPGIESSGNYPADCTKIGYGVYTCDVCGLLQIVQIRGNHIFSEGVCTICGTEQYAILSADMHKRDEEELV